MSPEDLAAQLEQLHAAAFGWALSCCGWDRAAAEDVLQQAILNLYQHRDRYDWTQPAGLMRRKEPALSPPWHWAVAQFCSTKALMVLEK